MSAERQVVMVFGRAPVPGTVKTRLAAGLGHAWALEAHCRLLYAALRRACEWRDDALSQGVVAEVLWYVAGAPEGLTSTGQLENIAGRNIACLAQQGATLGERMEHALRATLRRAERALIIGADCADMTPDDLVDAMAALGRSDGVIAPAQDGGYTLIGLHQRALTKPIGGLFSIPAWGSSTVFVQSIHAAQQARLDLHVLRTMWDVDEPEDWYRWLAAQSALRD